MRTSIAFEPSAGGRMHKRMKCRSRPADGKVDLARELVKCSRCERSVLNTAIVCPYCGTRQKSENMFDRA